MYSSLQTFGGGIPQPPRFAVDYCELNAITSGDGYPIPSVSDNLDALSGGKLFVKLDLASGYWQVPVTPAHVHKIAFAAHLGLYACRLASKRHLIHFREY